jgi:L-asparaginase
MSDQRPRVVVIGCGGTISSLATSNLDTIDYPDSGRKLAADEVLARVPEARQFAEIVSVPFREVSSTALTITDWFTLRQMIRQSCSQDSALAGIVVLHGTGSLEETAFFLHLTLDVGVPVVVVGAQRPLNAVSSDAPGNLISAVRVAADPRSAGRGVLIVMNDEIHSARDVVKTSNYRLQTFRSPDYGPVGQVDGDAIGFTRRIDRPHTIDSPFAKLPDQATLPRVDILYSYLGADDVLIEAAVAAGAGGLVSAGFPPGLVTPAAMGAFERLARTGFPVVLASRAPAGRVAMRQRILKAGLISGGDFSPQKARIILLLGLASSFGVADLQHSFATL